jgi:pyridoxal phosphate enzyme (YggS family)
MTDATTITRNLTDVRASIAGALELAAGKTRSVKLVVVSKTHGPEAIEAALHAGETSFGENKVQEAEAKWPGLKRRFPDSQLHLIGPLQSNKAAAAVRLFDVIETVDRVKIATILAKQMDAAGRWPKCFVQINTGEEQQKAGIFPKDADAFIKHCRTQLALPIVGLMCLPPINEEPALHFAFLREIAERNNLFELSMGMSADFLTAIEFGATSVRLGTAIFGARSKIL